MKRYRAKRETKVSIEESGSTYGQSLFTGHVIEFNPDDFELVEEEKEIEPIDLSIPLGRFSTIEDAINTLIETVNQLQKQVKEIKEK